MVIFFIESNIRSLLSSEASRHAQRMLVRGARMPRKDVDIPREKGCGPGGIVLQSAAGRLDSCGYFDSGLRSGRRCITRTHL